MRRYSVHWMVASALGAGAAASACMQVPGPTDSDELTPTAVYQGAQASDAFSAIHAIGGGRIIAGKRSSNSNTRFQLSLDEGATWTTVGCPGSTGSHTYFFGQDGSTLLSGTGDTGGACIMRSLDLGSTWSVALSNSRLETLIGSADAKSVFGVVPMGSGRWLANVKSFDTTIKVIESVDNGLTWTVPSAQPGQALGSWARQMIRTASGDLLWPSTLTNAMYISPDGGRTWTANTVQTAKLFQPLCEAAPGVYLCGDVTTQANSPIKLYRSANRGQDWIEVASINLQSQYLTYWRDITLAGDALFASACCVEGYSNERRMQLFKSRDMGKTWFSLGNPYLGPYGNMQAIYQMAVTDAGHVFAACQPDSTILRWPVR